MKEEAIPYEVQQSAATDDDLTTKKEEMNVRSSSAETSPESGAAEETKDDEFSILANSAKRMARNPCRHFVVAFVASLAVSVAGFFFGDFSVSADNTGWLSRGTSIADQTTQLLLLNRHDFELNGNPSLWKDLTSNVQLGFEGAEPEDDRRRQLQTSTDSFTKISNGTLEGTGFLDCEATA